MAEIIDIYDANLNHIGEMERQRAHLGGQWHRTFHLWIVNSETKALLLQLRAPSAKNFPNLLDVTAAGHLHAGEEISAGIREGVEELGVAIEADRLISLGYRVEVADQENGQKNREYQAVHLLTDSRLLQNYKPDPNEVYGLVSLPIDDGLRLFSSELAAVTAPAFRFDSANKTWSLGQDSITRDRFLPRIQNYYLTMLIMAERLCEGRRVFAIS